MHTITALALVTVPNIFLVLGSSGDLSSWSPPWWLRLWLRAFWKHRRISWVSKECSEPPRRVGIINQCLGWSYGKKITIEAFSETSPLPLTSQAETISWQSWREQLGIPQWFLTFSSNILVQAIPNHCLALFLVVSSVHLLSQGTITKPDLWLWPCDSIVPIKTCCHKCLWDQGE